MLGERRRSGEIASGSLPFLLAINSPRLVITTTGWGPGRYAARASAGPIRNSIFRSISGSLAMFAAMRLASSHLAQRAPNVPSVAATCS